MKNKLVLITLCSLGLTSCATTDKIFSKSNATSTTSLLSVHIEGGQMIIPPTKTPQNYLPVTYQIANGQCQKVKITSANSSTATTVLQTCYLNNILSLDANRFNINHNALRFHPIPLWQQGYTYQNISSNGPARLTNVAVTIKIGN